MFVVDTDIHKFKRGIAFVFIVLISINILPTFHINVIYTLKKSLYRFLKVVKNDLYEMLVT